VITNLSGSAGPVHGKPAAYNVVEDEGDTEDGSEEGILQNAQENESGKGMHGSGEGRESITGKRAHIPALEDQGFRKKVSVSSLGKSSRELEKPSKAPLAATTTRQTRHQHAKQVEAEAAEKPKKSGRGRPKNK
jgi:hypothetical protein